MGDAVLVQRVQDRRRLDPAQADIGPRHRRHRPGEAPAVAMEHRQRPQIDGVLRHPPGERVADRVQVGAAVVVDDALRVAGGARRVVERDRIPLVARQRPRIVGIGRRPGTPRTSSVRPARRAAPARPRCRPRTVARPPATLPAPRRSRWRTRGRPAARGPRRGARMKAIVSASSRTLSAFSTAPHIGTPKCASTIAGVFGAMMATVWPGLAWPASAAASRRQRA